MRIMISLAVLAGLGLAVVSPAVAATLPGTPSQPYESFQPPPPVKPVLHKPLGTIFTAGFAQVLVSAGQKGAADGLTTVNCPATNGCTVLFTGTVQILSSNIDTNWAICFEVDGFSPDFSCLYQSPIRLGGGFYTMGAQQGGYSVAKGKHTVQTKVYFQADGEIYNYDLAYELTTP